MLQSIVGVFSQNFIKNVLTKVLKIIKYAFHKKFLDFTTKY
jgi:hypothetical protein